MLAVSEATATFNFFLHEHVAREYYHHDICLWNAKFNLKSKENLSTCEVFVVDCNTTCINLFELDGNSDVQKMYL